jgi:hypothetical protein
VGDTLSILSTCDTLITVAAVSGAHPSCNRSKSDTLAGGPHLERWLERIDRHADALQEIGMAAGMLADAQVSRKIAAWGYSTAIARGGSAWLAPGRYEAIDQRYSTYFTP